MTLIKDLIDIPDHIQQGDFVLRLAEGVNRAEETLREYVVTPELQHCFDDALSFIRSALQTNTSKASYLHGSFGSGKSHFMAVLHLILQGNTAARSIPELAATISKHNEWIAGKKFLLVPYHMIGATDMESGILGGYVDFLQRTHPDAPIPGVYLAEGLFQDAENLRQQMGDKPFFEALSEGTSNADGWGELETGWDQERFENANVAQPGSEERSLLISALVKKFFSSYNIQASNQKEAFVPLDTGLSVLSRHAALLGYDGLILFLDELILWLASRATDLQFVHQEGQKLAKLVEAQASDRPIPLISLVARQRDLSELIGDSVPGAERLNFGDALKHWEGRFHRITLEDRNLPAIAEKRVLKCKTEAARKELDASFEQTKKIRETVMTTLLTSEGDQAMFRKVYPFSPALVQTLIAVSSVLQRERTALKVMMQLLVEQRETLQLGDIIPVGDLFDLIAHGDEAFSQEMAIHFDKAKRLYHQKLLPLLEKEHGRFETLEQLAENDAKRIAFRNDDRLVKTLLLAALVPEVESLHTLNAERLAALNHGTIKSPIPGHEGQLVLGKCRTWAANIGEIRVGEETNPTISVQLSGVDTQTIIEQARIEDTQGNRVRLVREMIFEQLGIKDESEIEYYRDFLWKNTKRSCVVLFRNIRDLPDTSLENSAERWKLIIDFPFDEVGRGARDDTSKIQSFRESHPDGAKTLCWVPAFFSPDAQKDLGTLVILEHILAGERFTQYASHLSPQDRPSAKSQLDNQRSMLRQRVKKHLDAAYGLESQDTADSVDRTQELELSERFVSLQPGLTLQPPVAATLVSAMDSLLDQALAHEFPGAPAFETELKTNGLKKVYEQVYGASLTADGRLAIDKPVRPLLRAIANPLQLGEMGADATHFVLGQHWKTHFTKKVAETGGTLSVSQLRNWIDDPQPKGLPREAENILILLFAAQTNRSFFLHGAPLEPTLTELPDQLELRELALPNEKDWADAVQRTGSIFGVSGSPLCNASNVANLSASIHTIAVQAQAACQDYCQQLQARLSAFGLQPSDTDRMQTANATLQLIERISSGQPDEVVAILATATIATTQAAMGGCFHTAETLHATLQSANWEIFAAIHTLTDERQQAAEEIRSAIVQALQRDEHVVQLGSTLQMAQARAVSLLTKSPQAPAPTPPQPRPAQPAPPLPVKKGKYIADQGMQENLVVSDAAALITRLEQGLKSGQDIRLNISWVIEEGGSE